MDFDADLSVAGERLVVEARSPQGESHGTAVLRPGLGRFGSPHEVGHELFELLFPGSVRSLFERCRAAARVQSEAVRVRIQVRDELKQVLRLQALPWEWMVDPDTGRALALGSEVYVVRYLKQPRPIPSPLAPGSGPLEVLVVMASPRDQRTLSYKLEAETIEAAFRELPVRVRVLAGATRASLHDALRAATTHVLHFIGHGSGPAMQASGVLVLENAKGLSDPVSSRTLTLMLESCPALRLVFLNACSTAALEPVSSCGVLDSVGPALALRGAPAVVAMRAPIQDESAVELARVFYESLGLGRSIESALAAARRAIALKEGAAEDSWTIPAVFSRLKSDEALIAAPLAPHVGPVTSAPSAAVQVRARVMKGKEIKVAGLVLEGDGPPVSLPGASVSLETDAMTGEHISLVGIEYRNHRKGTS